MPVAFQGELGAFSEEAVHRAFEGADPVPAPSFQHVVHAVAEGRAAYGVLPVENTLHGGVTGAYDALANSELRVVGEVVLPIRHCLLGISGARPEALTRVISHPVALAQCVRYLSRLPARVEAVYDTAGAARDVAMAGDGQVAAVASLKAGERYGLEVLESDIQDSPDNQTRFFIVSVADGPLPLPDVDRAHGTSGFKTALWCETPNEPGALLGLLQPFADHGVNLTKLESRPAPTPWTYRFFLEYAHARPGDAQGAVAEARRRSVQLHVLGTFHAAP